MKKLVTSLALCMSLFLGSILPANAGFPVNVLSVQQGEFTFVKVGASFGFYYGNHGWTTILSNAKQHGTTASVYISGDPATYGQVTRVDQD